MFLQNQRSKHAHVFKSGVLSYEVNALQADTPVKMNPPQHQ